MLVTRRTVLKQVLFVSAGLALLPSCFREKKPPVFKLNNFEFSSDEEATLVSLADVIIPAGDDKPGAIQVKADQYAMTILDDCYTMEQQQKFLAGLKAFHKEWKDNDPAYIKKIDGAAGDFFNMYRDLIVQGYTNSEYYLTKVFPYELVPGRFHGSVLVNKG